MQKDSEPAALSEAERRILATIEAELEAGDPGLAARFRRRLVQGSRPLTLLAVAAVVGGAALMVATFTTSLLLASIGATLMAIGAAAGSTRVALAGRRWFAFLGRWVDPNGGELPPEARGRRP
jgi:hypothetical protein